jgi:hypothetical protein
MDTKFNSKHFSKRQFSFFFQRLCVFSMEVKKMCFCLASKNAIFDANFKTVENVRQLLMFFLIAMEGSLMLRFELEKVSFSPVI